MSHYIQILCLLLIALPIFSCQSTPLPSPKATPAPGAIRIHLISHPKLNWYGGGPHSLSTCVYQLSSRSIFDQHAEDPEGVAKLKQCRPFDGSMKRTSRKIMYPNINEQVNLDRSDGTLYVAFVAAYQKLQRERMIRIYKIPVVEETKGWIRREKKLVLGILDVEIKLGPEQIDSPLKD